MKGTKILVPVLAVALMVFMIAPIASAQQFADILNGQWFKIKASMKGYEIDNDNETVTGKGSGNGTVYLKMTFNNKTDPSPDTYTITTCMQDDENDSTWHKITNIDIISKENIYGAIYPQVWDFGGNPISFTDGYTDFDVYLLLYTKISVDKAGSLKTATISTISGSIWAEFDGGDFALGSCTLSGSLISATQVTKKVPAACLSLP
jgi:hypothetical protein